jgi:aspartate racemase
LAEKFGLQVLIPEEADRETVHRVIYNELVKGEIREESQQRFLAVIERLQDRGAQGIILGCTEIPLLVKPSDVSVPIFDTTQLHAEAAVAWALG